MLAALVLAPHPCAAADKSGVGLNAISLPDGPGSIEGLGESFQPTLNTGTAKYRLPLRVPPGTAGHAPELALEYDGGSGNGPLGYGWSLPIFSVQRQSDEGIPLYTDQVPNPLSDLLGRKDRFINEAREELVPTADGFYFCRNEGAFVRYRQTGDSWEGTDPHGIRMAFGITPVGRVTDESGSRTWAWLLERVADTHGNTILYRWRSFAGSTNVNQRFLEEISYGPGVPPWTNLHFIHFEYEDRTDWFEDNRAGFPVRTGKRLKKITMGTQGPALEGHLAGDFNQDGISDHLVRRYDLEYRAIASEEPPRSLLARVQLIGADGITALPPATFEYQVAQTPALISAAAALIESFDEPPVVMDQPHVDFLDLNADALPDILRTDPGGGPQQVYLNRGSTNINGRPSILWSAPVEVGGDTRAWGVNLQSQANIAHLADMNGDGLADLVYRSTIGDVYYFRNERMSWGARLPMSVGDTAPPSPFGNANVRTADIDFDKRIDVIQSISTGGGTDYRIWFNLGDARYARSVTVLQEDGSLFSGPGIHVAEINGDRVPDIARVRPFGVEASAGLGYGKFAASVRIALPDLLLTSEQAAQANLTDITGDGLDDLVLEQPAPGRLWFWLNQGNYTFGSRIEVFNMPATIGINTAIRWADINGNGSVDIIYADSSASPRLRAVDLGSLMGTDGGQSVLVRIANGIGRVTDIDYEPSTAFALRDAAAGQAWPDPMPFPVNVVSQITTSDSLGHEYITRFQYHDGYYDPEEKQFRGFARVEQIELGDSTAPTLVTRSRFDTGRAHEAMKGKLLRLTTETEDGRVFRDDFTAWQLPPRVLMTGTNGQAASYAYPTSTTNIIKELDQGLERQLESELVFDDFGNQTLDADYGIVENGNRSAFDDERITVTQFAINTNAWILRTPARQEIRDETGAVISRADHFYDDETFSGNNWGIVTIGNLTMKREWIDPADPAAVIKSARTKYDSFGNPVTLLDPLADAPGGALDFNQGHARRLDYDFRFQTYPITETIHLGDGKAPLVFQAAYDEGFGTVTDSIDFNGNETGYGYDALGRMNRIVKPFDSREFPTVEYEYVLAQPTGNGGMVNYIETRQLDKVPGTVPSLRDHYLLSRQFIDGLGRKLMTKTEAESAPGNTAPRVAVAEAVLFNARQKPARVLNPCFSLQGATLDALLAFENLEAPGWQGQFHNDGSLVTLDLAAAHQTATEHDAMLREVKIVNPDSTFGRKVYAPLLTRSFDENDTDPASPHFDTPMVHYNDGLGRLVQVDEVTRLSDGGTPAGSLRAWTTRYAYDLNDQLRFITDSQNNVKEFRYDGLKRKTFMNDPDRGHMTWLYDDASNLRESIDAKSQRITYTYDGANRILTEDYHDGLLPSYVPSNPITPTNRPDVAYFYDFPVEALDLGDTTTATARNTKGMLGYVRDLSGEEHSSYDARGRVEWVVKRIPDPQFQSAISNSQFSILNSLVSYKATFAYDSLDRLTRLTYPDNDEVSYHYNARSLLEEIRGGINGLTQNGRIISGLQYWPSAQQATINYGNGVRTTYAHDARLRLSKLSTLNPQPSTELIHFTYDFDSANNITAIHDRRPGSAVAAGDPRRNTQLFHYDDLYRLTRAQYSFNLPGELAHNDGEINYRYDRIGNMLAQTSTIDHNQKGLPVANLGTMDLGGNLGRWNRTGRSADDPPGPHALTAIRNPQSVIQNREYSYDPNGNMLTLDGLTNTWDFKDRLITVESAEMTASYTYDYTDRRITKRVIPKQLTTNNGPLTAVYVNKGFEIREHDAPTKYIWNGETRVARVTGSLSSNTRIQRLRLYHGWNLCSLAVSISSPSPLWGEGRGEVSAAFRWNQSTLDWEPLPSSTPLPAGTILWLRATTNAILHIAGAYSGPITTLRVPPAGAFLSSAALEVRDPGFPHFTNASFWKFDGSTQDWKTKLPLPVIQPLVSILQPSTIAPGSAFFVQSSVPVEIELPDVAFSVRYYHQDHLGSSSCVSDSQANLVDETTFYSFGASRTKMSFAGQTEAYNFIQKEEDGESHLRNLGARYLAAIYSRFLSCDPLTSRGPAGDMKSYVAFNSRPQQSHPYSYAANCPVAKRDVSGLAPTALEGAQQNELVIIDNLTRAAKGGRPNDVVSTLDEAASFERAIHEFPPSQRDPEAVVEDYGSSPELEKAKVNALNVLGAGSLNDAILGAKLSDELGLNEQYKMSKANETALDKVLKSMSDKEKPPSGKRPSPVARSASKQSEGPYGMSHPDVPLATVDPEYGYANSSEP